MDKCPLERYVSKKIEIKKNVKKKHYIEHVISKKPEI